MFDFIHLKAIGQRDESRASDIVSVGVAYLCGLLLWMGELFCFCPAIK